MSLDELEEAEVLLPEAEWGSHSLASTVSAVPFLVAIGVAAAGCALMYAGNGRLLTWLGLGAFLLGLVATVFVCDRAVLQQRKRVERERQQRSEHHT